MQQPQELGSSYPHLCASQTKLLIYGLKQVRRQWFGRFQFTLMKLHLNIRKCDPSLFTYLLPNRGFDLL